MYIFKKTLFILNIYNRTDINVNSCQNIYYTFVYLYIKKKTVYTFILDAMLMNKHYMKNRTITEKKTTLI